MRMPSASLPFSSVTTTGRFSIVPTPRIATWGCGMMGVPKREPKTPGFVTVKVPPWISSGFSFLERARSARSCVARASPRIDFSSAFLMTGTINPQSSATAMPRWTSLW